MKSDKFQPYKGIFKNEGSRKLDTEKMLYNLKNSMNLYGQAAPHM